MSSATAPAPVQVMTASVGAARRLQALARAGYGTGQLADLLQVRRRHVTWWRTPHYRQIHILNHRRIANLYSLLWDTDGKSLLARLHAEQQSWHPYEAWTDATIDDPGAAPYSDPEALAYIDWVLLDLVRQGKRRYLELTPAERRTLLREHVLDRNGSLRGFRDRYRPVPVSDLRSMVADDPQLRERLEAV
jgi:hypothetical protein